MVGRSGGLYSTHRPARFKPASWPVSTLQAPTQALTTGETAAAGLTGGPTLLLTVRHSGPTQVATTQVVQEKEVLTYFPAHSAGQDGGCTVQNGPLIGGAASHVTAASSDSQNIVARNLKYVENCKCFVKIV